MMGSMRSWLFKFDDKESGREQKQENRVAVVHCKAGKGRSGTVACGYLISEEGWNLDDALQRFTERRMRVGFGAGVSIPSQLRWVRYIDRWAKEMGKNYIERPVEILELHVWGLRDGVKVAVEGFVDEGKKIKCFHLFHRNERTVVDDGKTKLADKKGNNKNGSKEPLSESSAWPALDTPSSTSETKDSTASDSTSSTTTKPMSAIIFRPSKPIILPSSDVNIDFERRSKAAYTGWAMVTSIAHIWFNTYFEGGDKYGSGVFEAEWNALDGIKGTTKKGVKALDRLKVVWRYPSPSQLDMKEPEQETTGPPLGKVITVPKPGEPIPESSPADWHGQDPETDRERSLRDQENMVHRIEGEADNSKNYPFATDHPYLSAASAAAASAASATADSVHGLEKELGLRKQTDESKDVSLCNSDVEERAASPGVQKGGDRAAAEEEKNGNGGFEGVKSHFGEDGAVEGDSSNR